MKARVLMSDVIRQTCMTRATIDNLVFRGAIFYMALILFKLIIVYFC